MADILREKYNKPKLKWMSVTASTLNTSSTVHSSVDVIHTFSDQTVSHVTVPEPDNNNPLHFCEIDKLHTVC
jgi:hypothetical protein